MTIRIPAKTLGLFLPQTHSWNPLQMGFRDGMAYVVICMYGYDELWHSTQLNVAATATAPSRLTFYYKYFIIILIIIICCGDISIWIVFWRNEVQVRIRIQTQSVWKEMGKYCNRRDQTVELYCCNVFVSYLYPFQIGFANLMRCKILAHCRNCRQILDFLGIFCISHQSHLTWMETKSDYENYYWNFMGLFTIWLSIIPTAAPLLSFSFKLASCQFNSYNNLHYWTAQCPLTQMLCYVPQRVKLLENIL